MMTTEPKKRKTLPAVGPTSTDLRYYVTTILALVYASAWWTFGLDAPEAQTAVDFERSDDVAVASPSKTVWYHDLPVASRPVVQLPPNLQIHAATATQASRGLDGSGRPVRVPNRRPGRVRTRSS